MSKRIIKDYKAETKYIIDWIKDYFCRNGNMDTKAIIGISGGKDSTIVAYLCAAALGPERVVGVKMPNGQQHDIDAANQVFDKLNIEECEINIHDICQEFYGAIYSALDQEGRFKASQIKAIEYNAPPRLRMATLYAVAAALGGRVANTSNYSERFIGWTTKWGDSVGDFAPLADYTVEEVLNIGKELGVPDELLYKVPEDGLTGTTDEQAIGIEYALIDQYIRDKNKPAGFEVCKRIYDMNEASNHKRNSICLPHPMARLYWDDQEEDGDFYF